MPKEDSGKVPSVIAAASTSGLHSGASSMALGAIFPLPASAGETTVMKNTDMMIKIGKIRYILFIVVCTVIGHRLFSCANLLIKLFRGKTHLRNDIVTDAREAIILLFVGAD